MNAPRDTSYEASLLQSLLLCIQSSSYPIADRLNDKVLVAFVDIHQQPHIAAVQRTNENVK